MSSSSMEYFLSKSISKRERPNYFSKKQVQVLWSFFSKVIFPTLDISSKFFCEKLWLIWKTFSMPYFLIFDKSIIIFIPSMNWKMIMKVSLGMILLNYFWFNTLICINNTLYLRYITADRRYFSRFNCLYIASRTIC